MAPRRSSTNIARQVGRIIVLCLHRRYAPRVYIFYPLYKLFRRRLHVPMALSVLAVWLISAILHGVPAAMVGGPAAGLVFFGIFAGLGCLSAAVVLCTKRSRTKPR